MKKARSFILAFNLLIIFIANAQNLSFSGGHDHSIALCADGHVYSAGDNSKGVIGQGNFITPHIQYVKVMAGAGTNDGAGFLTGIRQVDAGSGGHSIALGCAGNLYTWGKNSNGQLGINNTTNQNLPQKVLTGEQGDASGFLTGATYISGGNLQTYAILSNGDLMGWGDNTNGAVGNNSLGGNVIVPAYVRKCDGSKLTNVIQVDAGDDFGVALLADGSVWAWGNNSNAAHGPLGQGSYVPSASPCAIPVKGPAGAGYLTNVAKITAGDTHVLAIADDHTLWGWGGDWAHQLAVNSSIGPDILYPDKVLESSSGPNLSDIIDVSAGNNFSIALKSDGTVWTWGANTNNFGQLGRAAGDYPQMVPGLTNIIGVSEGDRWSFAIESSGNVYEFGENTSNGHLGLNSSSPSFTSPTLITTLSCTASLSCPDASLPAAITVCANPNVLLNSGSLGSSFTYVWKYNGLVIPGATSSTYTATGEGTYRVIISDATMRGCGLCPKDSDEVVITSTSNATALPPNYCALPSNLNFCISGPSGNNYNWYGAATGGVALNGSPTSCYNATVISAPAVFYAEDLTAYSYSTGYSIGELGMTTNSSDWGLNNTAKQKFDVLNPITISQVKFKYTGVPGGPCGSNPTFPFQLQVQTSSGATVGSYNTNLPCSPSTGGIVTLPINIAVPVGTGYRMLITSAGMNVSDFSSGPSYPFGIPFILQFTGTVANTNSYGPFYDWQITSSNTCGRVAVQAILNCAAPVELIDFNAIQSDSFVLLTWVTANEKNNNYFVLERSDDGITFYPIGKINGVGNSDGIQSYSFIDKDQRNGTSYYRLQQVDYNMDINLSEIIEVNYAKENVQLYPNPFNDHINLFVASTQNEKVSVEVYDLTGKKVYATQHFPTNQHYSFGWDIAPGAYVFKISWNGSQEIKKLTKAK